MFSSSEFPLFNIFYLLIFYDNLKYRFFTSFTRVNMYRFVFVRIKEKRNVQISLNLRHYEAYFLAKSFPKDMI
jgi:hypothetical protein